MTDNKIKKLLRAAELLLPQSDRETELDKLVATSLQAGYELGKLSVTEHSASAK